MKVLLYIVTGILFVAVAMVTVFLPESYAGMASETLHFAHKRVKDFQPLLAGILAAAAGSLVYFAAKAQINEQRLMEEQRKKDERDALVTALVAEIINCVIVCKEFALKLLSNATFKNEKLPIALPFSQIIYKKNAYRIGILPPNLASAFVEFYSALPVYEYFMKQPQPISYAALFNNLERQNYFYRDLLEGKIKKIFLDGDILKNHNYKDLQDILKNKFKECSDTVNDKISYSRNKAGLEFQLIANPKNSTFKETTP